MRKLIEQNEDPLLEFLHSMYKSTKSLPWSPQLKIKRQFFNTVLEEEKRVEIFLWTTFSRNCHWQNI